MTSLATKLLETYGASEIDAVYALLQRQNPDAYGSTRFETHGYLDGVQAFDSSTMEAQFPGVEFAFTGQLLRFRMRGSKGWWTGRERG